MGLLDKVFTAGGVVLIGALARSAYRDAQETKRRKNSALCFDDGLTQGELSELAGAIAKRTLRVEYVVVIGMTAHLYVRSNSGLSTWSAEIDFNDYGHLTGAYWLESENDDSLIPTHFANAMQRQIRRRVSMTTTQPWQPRSLPMSPDGTHYWDGQRYTPMPIGFTWDGYQWVPTRV